jgi:CRP-like cAMP-binding protein
MHIPKASVSELLHDYKFVMRFIKALSQNSLGMNKKIVMLTQKTLRENILDYLKQQAVIQKSSEVILPVSKKELAERLGVQRPSLFRELKRLQADEVIVVKNRFVRIIGS